MSEPKDVTLDTWVSHYRDIFDLHKKLADKHQWPAFFLDLHPYRKSNRILMEWLMTTEYDLYKSATDPPPILITPEVLKDWENWDSVSIWVVPKGSVDVKERIKIVRAHLRMM